MLLVDKPQPGLLPSLPPPGPPHRAAFPAPNSLAGGACEDAAALARWRSQEVRPSVLTALWNHTRTPEGKYVIPASHRQEPEAQGLKARPPDPEVVEQPDSQSPTGSTQATKPIKIHTFSASLGSFSESPSTHEIPGACELPRRVLADYDQRSFWIKPTVSDGKLQFELDISDWPQTSANKRFLKKEGVPWGCEGPQSEEKPEFPGVLEDLSPLKGTTLGASSELLDFSTSGSK